MSLFSWFKKEKPVEEGRMIGFIEKELWNTLKNIQIE